MGGGLVGPVSQVSRVRKVASLPCWTILVLWLLQEEAMLSMGELVVVVVVVSHLLRLQMVAWSRWVWDPSRGEAGLRRQAVVPDAWDSRQRGTYPWGSWTSSKGDYLVVHHRYYLHRSLAYSLVRMVLFGGSADLSWGHAWLALGFWSRLGSASA